jgi:hypothetical protein
MVFLNIFLSTFLIFQMWLDWIGLDGERELCLPACLPACLPVNNLDCLDLRFYSQTPTPIHHHPLSKLYYTTKAANVNPLTSHPVLSPPRHSLALGPRPVTRTVVCCHYLGCLPFWVSVALTYVLVLI